MATIITVLTMGLVEAAAVGEVVAVDITEAATMGKELDITEGATTAKAVDITEVSTTAKAVVAMWEPAHTQEAAITIMVIQVKAEVVVMVVTVEGEGVVEAAVENSHLAI